MKVTINIQWNTEGMDIPSGHEDALRESGIERALTMASKGYVAGELTDNIVMNDDDPEDGVEYRGWWELHIEYR